VHVRDLWHDVPLDVHGDGSLPLDLPGHGCALVHVVPATP
jgi:hypothetical protein